jgi:hypothetical protein
MLPQCCHAESEGISSLNVPAVAAQETFQRIVVILKGTDGQHGNDVRSDVNGWRSPCPGAFGFVETGLSEVRHFW